MDPEQLLDTAVQAARQGVGGLGIHVHRSGLYRPGDWCGSGEAVFRLVAAVQEASGLPWPGVTWAEACSGTGRKPIPWICSRRLRQFRGAYQKHLGSCGLDQIGIHPQLGRFLAAPSGIAPHHSPGGEGRLGGGGCLHGRFAPRLPWRGVQYHASLLGTDCLQGRSSCFLSGWSADSLDHFGAAASFPRSDLAMSAYPRSRRLQPLHVQQLLRLPPLPGNPLGAGRPPA